MLPLIICAVTLQVLIFHVILLNPLWFDITELVTDSLKYVFLENEGLISINFTRESGNLPLMVNDNGVGLPEHLLHEEHHSLDISLVKMPVNQLDDHLKNR